jgi:hypothetical protein
LNRKPWGYYGSSDGDSFVFFLLLLVGLVFGHFLGDHVTHQPCIPVLAFFDVCGVTLLGVE